MKNATYLEDLYHGNIRPNEKCFVRDLEYSKLFQIIIDNEKILTKFLAQLPNSEEEQQLFSQMIDSRIEAASLLECDRFIEGFRLGASIMLETFVLPQKSILKDIN